MSQDGVAVKHEISSLTLPFFDLVNSIINFKEQDKFFS